MDLRHRFLTAFFPIFFTAGPFASASGDTPLPAPQVENDGGVRPDPRPGHPFRFVYKDGRVAELYFTGPRVFNVKIPLDTVENECQPKLPMKCALHLEGSLGELQMRWSESPNANQLGHIVKVKRYTESQFTPIEGETVYEMWPTSRRGKPIALECDDFRWLPDDAQKRKAFVINEWTGEIMLQNSFTELNENQVFLSLRDLKFRVVSATRAEMTGPTVYPQDFNDDTPFVPIGGDVTGFNVGMPGGESCDIRMSPNISEFRTYLQVEPGAPARVLNEEDLIRIYESNFRRELKSNFLNLFGVRGSSDNATVSWDPKNPETRAFLRDVALMQMLNLVEVSQTYSSKENRNVLEKISIKTREVEP